MGWGGVQEVDTAARQQDGCSMADPSEAGAGAGGVARAPTDAGGRPLQQLWGQVVQEGLRRHTRQARAHAPQA